MPISAIGNSVAAPAGEAGFTLVELMVVMVIVGLMTAAVIVTIPDGRGRLSDDAVALAARLVAARDLAIIGGHDVAARFGADGYDFVERRGRGWVAPAGKALVARRWRDGTTGEAAIESDATLVFDGTGLATPAVVTLTADGEQAQVSIDAAGGVRVAGR